MSYTITAAAYANAENTAARVETEEAGAVILTQEDTPDAWADLQASEIEIAPFAPPPAPVPAVISDRQFAQQLAILGAITEAEALAWAARGDLPAALDTAIAGLPEPDRFAARMLLAAATTYERQHPLVADLGDAMGYDGPALDNLWSAAAQL